MFECKDLLVHILAQVKMLLYATWAHEYVSRRVCVCMGTYEQNAICCATTNGFRGNAQIPSNNPICKLQ